MRSQRGNPLVKYTVLLVTLVVVLLASCPAESHAARVLRDYTAAQLSKKTELGRGPDNSDGIGKMMSNAERLVRGLPLKKPQLRRDGE